MVARGHTACPCIDVTPGGKGLPRVLEWGPGQWVGPDHLSSPWSRTISPSEGKTVVQSPLVGKDCRENIPVSHRHKENTTLPLGHMEGCD